MRGKIFAIFWVVGICTLSGWLIMAGSGKPPINADLMSLLPKAERDPVVRDAVTRVKRRFERHVVLLVGAKDKETAKSAVTHVHGRLAKSGRFRTLRLKHDQELIRHALSFYFPLRFQLLSNGARDQLTAGDKDGFQRAILKRYYSPKTSFNSQLVEKDPLLLLPRFLDERRSEMIGLPALEDGYLIVRTAGKIYVLLIGELAESPFSFSVQQQLMPLLNGLRTELPAKFKGADFLLAGVLPHAAAGTDTALDEMSTVGLGSLLGIVAMLIVLFRSSRPFVLTLMSIGLGCLGGFAACLAVFGEVHLLSLVFGASLVGISVDYSLHYFCERFRFGAHWSPAAALNHIFPGITLGLITSVIGFTGLFFAPFPGMQGMALFSSVGLCIAYSCVAICYPPFTNNLSPPKYDQPLSWVRAYGDLWRRRPTWRTGLVLSVLAIIAIFGCLRLVASDDVRLLQTPDAVVMAEEMETRTLIGRNLASQFFLVEGRDDEDFLIRGEALTGKLRSLQKTGQLSGYRAISDFIASPQRQTGNRALLKDIITSGNNILDRVAQRIGLPDRTRADYVAAFEQAGSGTPASLGQWLAHPVSAPHRHLWLGKTARGVIGVVGLRGVHDLAALHAVADSDKRLHFVDPAGDISTLFGQYRHQTIWLTLISYGLVLLILLARYGVRGGLLVMASPVIAAVASLSMLGFLGESISLFNIMALLLVLGIGVDYSLFFRETGTESPATLLAIALSSLTTLLAFGLLALSATTAIHAFGLTILVGILVAFFLSPMAGWGHDSTTEDGPTP
ncbi:MAG: MMPL family transporter [Rhodospirillaceae bacterium]|nr:MMPL family transporter [Rhodospirillaceae bacterium]MBT5457189.1 MMPL family transporter [Rhodospirillaceae bacterium]